MIGSSPDSDAKQLSAGLEAAGAPCAERMRVLIVDDAIPLRTTMALMLAAQSEFSVSQAGSYLEALENLDEVDAVVTDGSFPYQPGEAPAAWGLNLARLARAYGKRVVLISGSPLLVEQASSEGFHALEKPRGVLDLATTLSSGEPGVTESVPH